MRVRLHAHIGSVRGPITRAVKQRPPSTHPCPSLARAPSHHRHTRRWCAYQHQDYTTTPSVISVICADGWQQRFDVHLDVTIWIAPDHVCMSVRATQANDGPSESGRVIAARVVLYGNFGAEDSHREQIVLHVPIVYTIVQRATRLYSNDWNRCSAFEFSPRVVWTGEQQVL
eukprot:COSAG01_NODE_962_length_12418_cov_57.124492_11_plen_172_part_00